MITFIEGVDGSGKTTLCDKLVKKYGAIKVELPKRQNNKNKEYEEWKHWCNVYCNYIKNNQLVIADRSLLSELVYRMEDCLETFLTASLLEKFLVGAKFIWCTNDTTYEDAMSRGDDNIHSIEQHKRRETLYTGVMYFIVKILKIPFIRYDWHKTKISKVIKFIKGE